MDIKNGEFELDALPTKTRGRKKLSNRAFEVAERIKFRRLQLMLSISEVAERMSVPMPRYRSWEKQFGEQSEEKYAWALCQVLGVQLEWLTHGSGDSPLPIDASSLSQFKEEMNELRKAMGLRAKDRRNALKISLTELATQLDVPRNNLYSWERHLPKKVHEPTLDLWEQLLQVPHGWLTNLESNTPLVQSPVKSLSINQESFKTVSEAIRAIGLLIAKPIKTLSTSEASDLTKAEKRSADIFAARYGLYGEDVATLQGIGDRYGLTRERIRQIADKSLKRLVSVQVTDSSLIDILASKVSEFAPSSIEVIDAALREFLGENLSIIGAERFAREILGRDLFEISVVRTLGVDATHLVSLRGSTSGNSHLKVVRSISNRMIRSCGAAQLFYVTGAVSEELGKGLLSSEVLKHCQLITGFSWLSEEDGWFWFGDEESIKNRFLNVVRRVLAVAIHRVDVDDLMQATIRFQRNNHDPEQARPYKIEITSAVAVAILKQVSWVEVVQHNDFVPKTSIPVTEVLSEAELMIYDFMVSKGGAAQWRELKESLSDTGEMNFITLQSALNSSPIISRIDEGVFALRGWHLNAGRINTILESRQGLVANVDVDGWITYNYVLTKYAIVQKLYEPPRSVAKLMQEGSYRLIGSNHPIRFGKTPSGIPRLNGFISALIKLGFAEGQSMLIRVNPIEMLMEVRNQQIDSVIP